MKFAVIFIALNLTGCAYYDSQRYLHALKTDPDCTYQGKPAEYNMPAKCGVKSYGGSLISVSRVGPNTYSVSTVK